MEDDLWSSDDDSSSSASTAALSSYDVPKLEAHLYYAGLEPKGRGPKLIYRTSDDVFEAPSGPEAYKRLMRIVAVPDTFEFATDVTWDTVRDQVVMLLNRKNIKVTLVDFVRFTWLNTPVDRELEDEEEDDEDVDAKEEEEVNYDDIPRIQTVEYGDRHYTNPTIWIAVLPDTLTGSVAHDSSLDIRAYLDSLHIQNVDIAYRESTYKPSTAHGPALLAPAEDGGSLKDVIDNVSVALSLPIAGRKTTMQGTLGPYFRVGDKLYAITVRHSLFMLNGDNDEYRYHESAPKKEVMVMGPPAFNNYLASIQARIGTLVDAADSLRKKITTFRGRVEDGVNVVESQRKLDEYENELVKTRVKIDDLKSFFVDIKKNWSKAKDRVIGFVRWAPPLGVGVAPHRYTRDVCVIELYKDKFRSMIGNLCFSTPLSLPGPEMSEAKLKSLIYKDVDVPPEFKYPENGLLTLGGILNADQINHPTNMSLEGEHVRRVLKRGFTTNTTVGTLTKFSSFVRQYFPTGNMESLEIAILPHEQDLGTFSKRGDSGSLIVSTLGEFVALLTGGSNTGTDASHITYGTPFEWVWDLVKAEFPGAELYFNNLPEFLADVV
ncbi:hypothetical protein OH77DRAFT_1501754 [Trametes cingulata]|nr:hypothetical protein OH77DRAFT_1501754 [Trametes cingulata]